MAIRRESSAARRIAGLVPAAGAGLAAAGGAIAAPHLSASAVWLRDPAVAAILAGALAWAILYLGFAPRRSGRPKSMHRQLPPRVRPLPDDLDQPLSAFDPDAIGAGRGSSR